MKRHILFFLLLSILTTNLLASTEIDFIINSLKDISGYNIPTDEISSNDKNDINPLDLDKVSYSMSATKDFENTGYDEDQERNEIELQAESSENSNSRGPAVTEEVIPIPIFKGF